MKTSLRNFVKTAAVVAATCALFIISTLSAAEIKVVTSATFKPAYLELAPEYEHATNHKLLSWLASPAAYTAIRKSGLEPAESKEKKQ